MNDEKNPLPQTPTGDADRKGSENFDETAAARVDETAAARLDETDAGDWARSAPGAARHSPVAPAPTREREVLGDPLDSGTAAAPAAGAGTEGSRAATVASHAATTSRRDGDANRDPITGEPGAHPVGAGVGAAGGAVTGMAVGGAVGGPLGAAIGAVVGGVAGGLAGKGVAEVVNPTVEDEYWRANHAKRPYAAGRTYEDLAPAYRYGWESRAARPKSRWNEVEPDLERGWAHARGTSALGWNEVHSAVEEAWVRVDERLAGRPGQDPAGHAQSHADDEAEPSGTRR